MASDISIIPSKRFGDELPAFLSPEATEPALWFHRSMLTYQETPLVALPCLAEKLGVKNIFVKDESHRFGLNAFKALGASYAIAKIIAKAADLSGSRLCFPALTSESVREKVRDIVFVTATDGNHGKGVAWAASVFGCRATVFMPKGTKTCRSEAIKSINNTTVEITDFNYDDTVRLAAEYAEKHGFILVQDTGVERHEEIPNLITQGYTTMAAEAAAQLEAYDAERPTHLFLQAGVGSMAGGVLGYLAHYYGKKPPVTIIVESAAAACIFESVRAGAGAPCAIGGMPETIMAGLNCGEVNSLVWPVLRDFASFYASCPDWVTERGMHTLAHPTGGDRIIVSGESGAVGLGLLASLCTDMQYGMYKEALGLGPDSTVLLFSTEGDTDPESYRRIVGR